MRNELHEGVLGGEQAAVTKVREIRTHTQSCLLLVCMLKCLQIQRELFATEVFSVTCQLGLAYFMFDVRLNGVAASQIVSDLLKAAAKLLARHDGL